jgi:two-component system sensor histidine kinase LytS
MILQPLVENAIRHGIAPRRSGGTLKIVSVKENNLLVLRVQDDGFGFNSERKSEKGDGIGLLNTRTRLKHLYGDEQKFTLEAAPGEEGVAAVIEIPFVESSKKDDTEDTHFNS